MNKPIDIVNSNIHSNFLSSLYPQSNPNLINLKISHQKINKTSYYQKLTQRRPWTKEEDARILAYVQKNGKGKWSSISSQLQNRSGKQIRERYLQILDPKIEKKKFTPDDDHKIISLVEMHGSKWKYISSFLSNRSDNQIKNRFYTHIKKKILLADKEKYGHILEKIQQDNNDEENSNVNQVSNQRENDVLPSIGQSAFTKVEPRSHEESKEEIKVKQEQPDPQPLIPVDSSNKRQKPYPFRPPVLLIQRNDHLMQLGIENSNCPPQTAQNNTPTTASTVTNQSYGPQLLKAISVVSQLQAQMMQASNQFYAYFNMCQKMFPSYDFKELIAANNFQGQYQMFLQNQMIAMSPRIPLNCNLQQFSNKENNSSQAQQGQENSMENEN